MKPGDPRVQLESTPTLMEENESEFPQFVSWNFCLYELWILFGIYHSVQTVVFLQQESGSASNPVCLLRVTTISVCVQLVNTREKNGTKKNVERERRTC